MLGRVRGGASGVLGDLGLGSTLHFGEQVPEGAGRRRSPCRRESRRRPVPHSREERPGSQEVGDSRENMAVSCSPSHRPGLHRRA